MTRRTLLVITAINPIDHFADCQRDKHCVCRRAIFHLSITIEIAAYISYASYLDEYSSNIISDHLSPRIANNRARPSYSSYKLMKRPIDPIVHHRNACRTNCKHYILKPRRRITEITFCRDSISAIKYVGLKRKTKIHISQRCRAGRAQNYEAG